MLRMVELAPLVRAGIGAAAASSSSSSQRVPLPRQGSAGAIRASPASGRSEGAGELPAPLLSNARRRGRDPLWYGGGFSLGVDLGDARTGLAVGRGSEAARAEAGADAARHGSAAGGGRDHHRASRVGRWDGDTAVQQGAERRREARRPSGRERLPSGSGDLFSPLRGLRVYLQDEHGTSIDALDYMISRGVKKSARDVKSDAYAAVMILARYFKSSGQGAQIVLPRQPELQEKLIAQSRRDAEI